MYFQKNIFGTKQGLTGSAWDGLQTHCWTFHVFSWLLTTIELIWGAILTPKWHFVEQFNTFRRFWQQNLRFLLSKWLICIKMYNISANISPNYKPKQAFCCQIFKNRSIVQQSVMPRKAQHGLTLSVNRIRPLWYNKWKA